MEISPICQIFVSSGFHVEVNERMVFFAAIIPRTTVQVYCVSPGFKFSCYFTSRANEIETCFALRRRISKFFLNLKEKKIYR